jgi:hypothetical protein
MEVIVAKRIVTSVHLLGAGVARLRNKRSMLRSRQ